MTKNKTFNQLLINTAFAGVANSLVWFAVTFWVFLETKSVLATSYIAGVFALLNMISAVPFGGLVDNHKKKTVMLWSTLASLTCYALSAFWFLVAPAGELAKATSLWLWVFIITLMIGSVTGNLRSIALSTTVSMLFSDNKDKANGLIGVANGIGFAATSMISGLLIGYFGMGVVLMVTIIAMVFIWAHLLLISFPEDIVTKAERNDSTETSSIDVKGTLLLIFSIGGLAGLILFTTFNNFLGGVFMALMDAYGLSLVSVETWGLVLAITSPGFIIGSALVAKYGLGKNPLRLLLLANLCAWIVCILFPLQASVWAIGIGFFIFMLLHPITEAAEQTTIQTVVPLERQGRVFGLAQSVESLASPITTFLIGPIAAWVFIPFMTTGSGVELLGSWFGTGTDRGMALVFILTGIIGTFVTIVAFHTKSYRLLSSRYGDNHINS